MTDAPNHHEPTQEFSEFLARDIARTLRHDARFAPSPAAIRARRFGVVMASATGTVAVLAVGLVFGTSTGYASAREQTDRQRIESVVSTVGATSQLSELRAEIGRARETLSRLAAEKGTVSPDSLRAAESDLRAVEANAGQIESNLTLRPHKPPVSRPPIIGGIPMKTALAVTCSALALGVELAPAPQVIPTVTLPAATSRTSIALWSVAGIRQLPGGKLLVNDQGGRELRLFDSTLTNSTVTLDSNSYGARRPRAIPLTAYLGDSSLLVDPPNRSIRILDGKGQLARTVSLPAGQFNLAGPVYADDKGRVLFMGTAMWVTRPGMSDSVPVLRFDVAAGRLDTVGRVKAGGERDPMLLGYRTEVSRVAPVPMFTAFDAAGSLIPSRDDWAVLSDGSIAFVRGHDYHIDWIRANGAANSTAKLPFDWQALADENKKQLDARRVYDSAMVGDRTLRLRAKTDTGKRFAALPLEFRNLVGAYTAKLNLFGSASNILPDLDGNLWILPTAPQNGETIYDVINSKGELFTRVRIPADRTIAGFGKGGIVYLSSGDRANGFYIERTKFAGGR